MDLAEYVEKLQRTEQATDVNRWHCEGICVWPVFRAQTITMFRNPEAYFSVDGKTKEKTPVSLREKLSSRYHASRLKKKSGAQLHELLNDHSCEILLYSKEATHSDNVNGNWYDRFVDPFLEKLAPGHKVLKLQLTEKKEKQEKKYAHAPLLIDHRLFREFYFHHNRVHPVTAIAADPLFDEIVKATGISFLPRHIESVFNEILYYRALFREILPLVNPKIVFLKCYYETDSAGLVLAAKELGIKTVDIQHGKQGICHPMYTHWTSIPEKEYELLPDFFWNWGEESKQNILRWMNRDSVHVPVVGGNLWLAKWKQEDFYQPSPEERKFVEELSGYKKVVLLTLQPLDKAEVLPPQLADAIRQSPPGWIWLLRKHPFQALSEEDVVQLLGNTRAKTEMKFASSLPLYFLLKKVNSHVTLWSSTCFEANDFGVPTVIAHPFGQKLYEKQIGEGVFTFADEAGGILRFIEAGAPGKKTNYIETDSEIAKRAFEKLGLIP